jgi:hypothetical protein
MRKFLTWAPAILFLGIIGVVLLSEYGLLGNNTASLKITNRTATDITDIRISIYDQPCEFKRLPTGESNLCELPIESDGHYTITWSESNSADYREQAGYVTHGFDFNHEIVFLGAGAIDFKVVESE